MSKRPAFMFYPGDWLKDPNLLKCSLAAQGLWIKAICLMHENGQSGKLSGSYSQMANLLACSQDQLSQLLHELRASKTGLIRFCNGNVTITCRRMRREAEERKSLNDRVKRHREKSVTEMKRECNTNVTLSRARSSSSSYSKNKPPPNPPFKKRGEQAQKKENNEFRIAALRVYERYPRKCDKHKAIPAIESRLKQLIKDRSSPTLQRAEEYLTIKTEAYADALRGAGIDKKHPDWNKVKYAQGWYNGERYTSDENEWMAIFRGSKKEESAIGLEKRIAAIDKELEASQPRYVSGRNDDRDKSAKKYNETLSIRKGILLRERGKLDDKLKGVSK